MALKYFNKEGFTVQVKFIAENVTVCNVVFIGIQLSMLKF